MSDQTTPSEQPHGTGDPSRIEPRTSEDVQRQETRPASSFVEEATSKAVAAAKDELHQRIEKDFRYHAPESPGQTETYQRIRRLARNYAHELVELVPPSRELSRALSALEDVVHRANAGVARNT